MAAPKYDRRFRTTNGRLILAADETAALAELERHRADGWVAPDEVIVAEEEPPPPDPCLQAWVGRQTRVTSMSPVSPTRGKRL
jgi:hypothetical protein